MSGFVINVATDLGRSLGEQMARFADQEEAKHPNARKRCHDCAFRHGWHVANGSEGTLMNALKSAMERKAFWCHHTSPAGRRVACAGWRLLLVDVGTQCPWEFVAGSNDIDDLDPAIE